MQIQFEELIGLLTRGVVSPSFAGIYTCHDPYGASVHWRVWRRGRLARIEDPPGNLTLIAGENFYWRKWPVDPDVVELARSPEYDDFEMSALTMLDPEDYWRDWLEQDRPLVERTLHPVVLSERSAWEFTAPSVKGGTPVLTVDAELGIVLRAYRDDVGVFETWSEVRTDVSLADELFVYSGDWH